MAEQYSLDAQSRTVIGKQVKALRRQDLIPAVIYGAGGTPVHISCPRRPLEIVRAREGMNFSFAELTSHAQALHAHLGLGMLK